MSTLSTRSKLPPFRKNILDDVSRKIVCAAEEHLEEER